MHVDAVIEFGAATTGSGDVDGTRRDQRNAGKEGNPDILDPSGIGSRGAGEGQVPGGGRQTALGDPNPVAASAASSAGANDGHGRGTEGRFFGDVDADIALAGGGRGDREVSGAGDGGAGEADPVIGACASATGAVECHSASAVDGEGVLLQK